MRTMEQRVKRFVRARLYDLYARQHGQEDVVTSIAAPEAPSVGDNPLYNVWSSLVDPKFPVTTLHHRQREVIEELRTILALPCGTGLTEHWLKQNINGSIKLSMIVCNTMDDLRAQAQLLAMQLEQQYPCEADRPKMRKGASKGVRFLPINRTMRRFVTLDPTDMVTLFGLSEGSKELAVDIVRGAFKNNIKTAFGEKYADNKFNFTGTIDTDGTTVHIHFLRANRKQRPKEDDDNDEQPKPRSKPPPPPKLDGPPDIMLQVDNGIVNSIMMTLRIRGEVCYRETSGGRRPIKFVLTARQYHTLVGAHKARKMNERRVLLNLDGTKDVKNGTCLRTGQVQGILDYMKSELDNEDKVWNQVLHRSKAQSRRRRAMARERAVATWFQDVNNKVKGLAKEYGVCESEQITVVWGTNSKSTHKGCLPSPTGSLVDAAKRVPGWVIVGGDEWMTSQTHVRSHTTSCMQCGSRGSQKKECAQSHPDSLNV